MNATLGWLIQEGGTLIVFFPPPCTLLRHPRLLILAKCFRSPILFLCGKNRKQYLSRVLSKLAVVLKDVIALYSCFEAMVRKDTIVLHLYFEVSLCK